MSAFLSFSHCSGLSLQETAYRGGYIAKNKIAIGDVGLGKLIKTCVSDVNAWQHGGNTILGTIMLLAP